MQPLPDIDMESLRRIGWDSWDAADPDGPGSERALDHYLAVAACRLWNGEPEDDVADYLVTVETERLGMDSGPGMRDRALDVAGRIRAYLRRLKRGAAPSP